MIQIKKTLLTLVALLAVTTGAWADGTPGTNEFTVPSDWNGEITTFGPSDLPTDFVSITLDAAMALESPDKSANKVILLCTYDGQDFYYVTFTGSNKEQSAMGATKSFIYYQANSEGAKIYYTTAGSASTVTVAWNKTTKTGTFSMPGGNVELEPEYYPQAALTAAPTAINDVPATTDGAILKAGTVATIGSTEQAQGTVMYYVSPTALDDAALLALAADQWKADVPTAADLAQGQAYVYYYVRGNDSDTDDETFSDGDILAANALTVTIAAAPTYAVTFAEGTDANEWTASPATDVTKGQTVTVTYTGSKKVLGVKAEKKSGAASLIVNPVVGQIIGSDGKNYDANATLPDGVKAVAVIAYVGSETYDATFKNGLAIALADEAKSNWSTAMSTCEGKTAITGAKWCLPSQDQWKQMFKANGGNEGSYTGLNTTITNAGGTILQGSVNYWSSSEYNPGVRAYFVYLANGDASWSNATEGSGFRVRACLAF